MSSRITVIVCGTALSIVVAVIVVLRSRRQPLPPPDVSAALSPTKVCVKAAERNAAPSEQGAVAAASDAVAVVCGADAATADRYEARNDALRSIMRSRSLTKEDAAALLDYLASTNDAMRVERVAALKNDVMNLLRNQEPPVVGLAETLIGMLENEQTGTVPLWGSLQHLGDLVAVSLSSALVLSELPAAGQQAVRVLALVARRLAHIV
jgi:hypothetical protein